VAHLFGEPAWPYAWVGSQGRTPSETLNLQPGELVKVKSHEEILATLSEQKNRGMGFSPEMVCYCGVHLSRAVPGRTRSSTRKPDTCER